MSNMCAGNGAQEGGNPRRKRIFDLSSQPGQRLYMIGHLASGVLFFSSLHILPIFLHDVNRSVEHFIWRILGGEKRSKRKKGECRLLLDARYHLNIVK